MCSTAGAPPIGPELGPENREHLPETSVNNSNKLDSHLVATQEFAPYHWGVNDISGALNRDYREIVALRQDRKILQAVSDPDEELLPWVLDSKRPSDPPGFKVYRANDIERIGKKTLNHKIKAFGGDRDGTYGDALSDNSIRALIIANLVGERDAVGEIILGLETWWLNYDSDLNPAEHAKHTRIGRSALNMLLLSIRKDKAKLLLDSAIKQLNS